MKTFIVIALAVFLPILAVEVLIAELFNLSILKKFKKDPKSVPTKSGGFVINKNTKTVEEGSDQPILPYPRTYLLVRKVILIIGAVTLGLIVFYL